MFVCRLCCFCSAPISSDISKYDFPQDIQALLPPGYQIATKAHQNAWQVLHHGEHFAKRSFMKYGGETGAVQQLAKEAWTTYTQQTGNACVVKGLFEEVLTTGHDLDQPLPNPIQQATIAAAPIPQTTTSRQKKPRVKQLASTLDPDQTPPPPTPTPDFDQLFLADLAPKQPEPNLGRGRGTNRARGRGRSASSMTQGTSLVHHAAATSSPTSSSSSSSSSASSTCK